MFHLKRILIVFSFAFLTACVSNPTVDIAHAAAYSNIEYLQEYIDKGVDVNFQDQDGDTALMNAVLFEHVENVRLLLSKGADATLKSNSGATAMSLVYQIEPVNREIVELLVQHGANINDPDEDGDSLLSTAFLYHEEGDSRIDDIKFFIEQGIDVNAKDTDGTPTFWEVCYLSEEDDFKSVIDLFIDKGLDINAVDNENDTLLVLVACQENPKIYDYLVSKGAE